MTARKRLDYVDGLRGLACLYVAIYHLFLLWPVSSHVPGNSNLVAEALTRFAAYGHIGVDIFLALSGFCLFFPVCVRARTRNEPSKLELGTYAKRRARRILPPYLATVAVFSVLPFWSVWAEFVQPLPTLGELVSHLTLTHNLFPSTILRIDGPLWSLALEAQLYLVFPSLVVLFRRIGPLPFSLVLLAVTATFRFVAWGPFGVEFEPLETQFAVMASVPGRLFEFALGMVAADLVSRPRRDLTAFDWGRAALPLAIVCGVLAYAADKRFGEHSPLPSLLWGLCACGVLLCGRGEQPTKLVRILSWRPMVWVGGLSYSMYLLHEPLLRLSGRLLEQINLSSTLTLGIAIGIAGPLLLGIAAAFWYAFERPFLGATPTRTDASAVVSNPQALPALVSMAGPPTRRA